jgi:hypothetical protein
MLIRLKLQPCSLSKLFNIETPDNGNGQYPILETPVNDNGQFLILEKKPENDNVQFQSPNKGKSIKNSGVQVKHTRIMTRGR